MKIIELISKGQFKITSHERPSIKRPDDVLLKMGCVGICGSDIHYFTTGRIGDQIIDYPFVIGHECSATVVETGVGVKRLKPGDRVCVEPLYSCGECEQCQSDRRHTCLNQKFMGCPGQMGGGLSEFLILPEQMCVPFPESMTFKQAVLVEPLSIGLYTAGFIDNITDKTVAVLGFGPIGISVALSLRYRNCDAIVVSEKIKERIAAAEKSNIGRVFDANEIDYEKKLIEAYPSKFDAVIDCCGEQSALDTAQRIVKPGGKILLVGIPETDKTTFNPHELRRNEVCIQNVRRQNNCVEEAIRLISGGYIHVDFMITHIFQPRDVKKAFHLVSKYEDGVIKALIDMSRIIS